MSKVTKEELMKLFENQKIKNGQSRAKLGSWGGVEGLMKSLRTSAKSGISRDPADHEKRKEQYGNNDPIVKQPSTILDLILENFEDDMLRILCISAVISLVLGIATEGLKEGWLQGSSILIAVVIIVSVTAGNNYIKEKQFQKLNAVAQQKDVEVIRGSVMEPMSVYDLLVGDIVTVTTGQIISVDGILIGGHDIAADESALTGEPIEIKKRVPQKYTTEQKADPFLISGSKIVEGAGTMLVVAVGQNSVNGQLKMTLQQTDDKTPLQQKLTDLADKVGQVGMYSAGATFAAMFIHYIYDVYMTGDFMGNFFSAETLHQIIEYFIIAVSIIVVAVPEGLPLSVTIALAYSVGKMREENNLVRYLQACETMGGANNICSDKTGTLTKNLMQVTKIFIEQGTFDNIDSTIFNEDSRTVEILCQSVCNNTSANPEISRNLEKGFLQVNQRGNKTECALLEMSYRMGYDYKSCRLPENQRKIFTFSSEKKMMGTIYERKKGEMFAFVKGAPDYLIPCCSYYIDRNGKKAHLSEQFREQLDNTIHEFANESLRTILLTYKVVSTIPDNFQDIQNQLIIVGLVGIKDPLRDGIAEAVKMCGEAGVMVRMVTGDNKNTAVAIAKEAGILQKDYTVSDDDSDYTVLEGYQFRELCEGIVKQKKGKKTIEKIKNLDKFKQIAAKLKVLARSSPKDKFMLATGLKQMGQVVAMTGDGTNDAPALKKADIGFAMGIAGTEVAKQASGIILLDDNFRSIVTAMKWGRNIFDSIRKFLQFQLTVNFVALVMAFTGGAVLRESPLNPIQMLWVNLIMDTLASLALATQPPNNQLLKRKPYSRRESLITPNMWKNIIAQGCVQILILGTILFKGPQILGVPSSIGVTDWNEETGKHYSIFFNVFVLLQVFNEINARKLKPQEVNVFEKFFNNTLFVVILISTVIIQLTMIKYGGKSMKTVELSFAENLLCIALGSTALLSGLIIKVFLPKHLIICLYGIQINQWKYYWKEPPAQVEQEEAEPEEQEEGDKKND